MQNVVGGVVAQRIGHPDDDGAVFGQGAEPLYGEGTAFVVTDLLEVADDEAKKLIRGGTPTTASSCASWQR